MYIYMSIVNIEIILVIYNQWRVQAGCNKRASPVNFDSLYFVVVVYLVYDIRILQNKGQIT